MKKINKKKQLIYTYIEENIKEIIIISLIFIIGVVFGILLINNVQDEGKEEITTYVNTFVSNIKQGNSIDRVNVVKTDIKKDVLIGIILWIAGSTVVGIPIVYGIIGYRGFCLGYTVAAIIAVIGAKHGILIAIIGILMQNIVFIPSIILIAASGAKLYKKIIKNKNRENIKLEICKHSIISSFGIIGIIISSFIEVFLSTNLLIFFAKYI